jgi:hypothetical protein
VKELKQENLALKNENSKFREFLQTVLSNLTYVKLTMTIIKNHFEVFLVTSKKHGNGIIESKVGLYSIKASSHIFVS